MQAQVVQDKQVKFFYPFLFVQDRRKLERPKRQKRHHARQLSDRQWTIQTCCLVFFLSLCLPCICEILLHITPMWTQFLDLLPERLKEFIGVEENWKSVIFNMKQTSNSGRFIQSNQNKRKRQKIGLAG